MLALVGVALLPLISAQGGHGTQWIGEWALTSRLQAIPQYYLTDYYGASLGHGIELLVALPILAGIGYGLWRVLTHAEERGALIALTLAAGGILLPIALVALGADYLAPRNLVAAMIPRHRADRGVVPSSGRARIGHRAGRDDRGRVRWRSRSTWTSAPACSAATGAAWPGCCAARARRHAPARRDGA